MIQLPSKTIHVDMNDTLVGWDQAGCYSYLYKYAREVTYAMSKEYDLVCLSFCGAVQPGVRNLLLEDNAMFIEKYFPWFKRIESASGNKALHPGVEFLIDDSPHYFTTGKHGGILFTSWPTTRIREGIVYASNWLDIAKIMEII